MATNKTTKRDYFEALKAFVNGKKELVYSVEEVTAFIDNELTLLEKKANRSSTKPTANQKANEDLKKKIVEILSGFDKPVTISELMTVPEMEGNSNQKLSALMKQLVDNGEVVKTIDKKKSFFSVEKVDEPTEPADEKTAEE